MSKARNTSHAGNIGPAAKFPLYKLIVCISIYAKKILFRSHLAGRIILGFLMGVGVWGAVPSVRAGDDISFNSEAAAERIFDRMHERWLLGKSPQGGAVAVPSMDALAGKGMQGLVEGVRVPFDEAGEVVVQFERKPVAPHTSYTELGKAAVIFFEANATSPNFAGVERLQIRTTP